MPRLTLASVLVLVMVAVIPAAQPAGIDFGREVQNAKCEGVQGTRFKGRAENFQEDGSTILYENVTILFAGAAMTLRAERVVHDRDKPVMEVSGNVRLTLDTSGEELR